MVDEISTSSGFILWRFLRAIWRAISYTIKDPFGAIRNVQRLKWWGVSWDMRGYLGMHRRENGPIYISCFQVYGKNNSKDEVKEIGGNLTSNITGESLDLTMEGMKPEETNGIPAKYRFFIQALFRVPNSTIEGIEEDDFIKVWSDFTFTFTLDGRKMRYRFRKSEVATTINAFRKETTYAPSPKITKK